MLLFPPGSLPNGPVVETKKALMLLDFQNDFVSPNGKLYAANTTNFLSKLPDLADRFREQGEVVWTKTEFREPRSSLSLESGGFCILLRQFLKMFTDQFDESSSKYATPATEDDGSQTFAEYAEPVVESDPEAYLASDIPSDERCCVPGTPGSDFPAILRAAIGKKDIVASKSQYSAFADMLLLHQLRTRRVTDLYICGTLSNISVYATALDAVRHGFQVTVVEDCLGYRSETCHVHAMRQMADNMCVEGIDYQELMDDLAGLLGDVVKEGTYSTKFEVDISRPTLAEKRTASAKTIDQWITGVEPSMYTDNEYVRYHRRRSDLRRDSSDSEHKNESVDDAQMSKQQSSTIDSTSPPRKRSTTDLDGDLEVSPHVRLSHQRSVRRSSYDAYARPDARGKKTKQRVRRATKDFTNGSDGSRPSPLLPFMTHGFSANATSRSVDETLPEPMPEIVESPNHVNKKPSKKAPIVVLGPGDKIGDGTSRIVYDVLSPARADSAFETLKANVMWQKMYHRSGEVPRLVAVQGDIVSSSVDSSTTYPIYRHPADESPELLPFDHTVETLRRECEKHVGHTLNHVLIQHYRSGEDNISEHSDKTLDIVRGSNIVNLSLGAKRTMTLRTKSKKPSPDSDLLSLSPKSYPCPQSPPSRTTQRVPLPHSSLFILSTSTNSKYLHAVRADKRRPAEKSPDELAFNGERISLTFRHVGTYVTQIAGKQLIWGQGATGKIRGEAKPVLAGTVEVGLGLHLNSDSEGRENGDRPIGTHGDDVDEKNGTRRDQTAGKNAEEQTRNMIAGFGRENHQDEEFDWEDVYGGGFDVVNFVTKVVAEPGGGGGGDGGSRNGNGAGEFVSR